MSNQVNPEIYEALTDLNNKVTGQLILVKGQHRIVEIFEDVVSSRIVITETVKHIGGDLYDQINT